MRPIRKSFRDGPRCTLKLISLVTGPDVMRTGWELWGALSWLFVTLEYEMTSLSLEGKVIALMYVNTCTTFGYSLI